MKEQIEAVSEFIQTRKVMAAHNTNSSAVLKLLAGEITELAQEVGKGDKHGIEMELPDCVWFLITIAINEGIDLEEAFAKKRLRNDVKFPPELFNNGNTYDEAVKLSKEQYMGDETFYEIIES